MKRLAVVAATVMLGLSLARPGLAQQEQKTRSIGIRAGVDLATLGGDVTQVDSKLGFAAGVLGGMQFGEYWGVQPFLFYGQKGGKDSGVIGAESADRTISFSYIELQLPLVVRPEVRLGKVDMRLSAGPYAALKVGCSLKVETPSSSSNSSCDDAPPEYGAPQIKSLDYGLTFGVGLDLIGRGSGGLTLDAGYDLGLANINDVANAGTIKNRAWQFLIGYVHMF